MDAIKDANWIVSYVNINPDNTGIIKICIDSDVKKEITLLTRDANKWSESIGKQVSGKDFTNKELSNMILNRRKTI